MLGISFLDDFPEFFGLEFAEGGFVSVGEFDLLRGSLEFFSFDHLLAVVPGTTGVGSGEGNLDSRNNDTGEETSGGLVSEEHSDGKGGDDDDGTGGDHLGEGGLG